MKNNNIYKLNNFQLCEESRWDIEFKLREHLLKIDGLQDDLTKILDLLNLFANRCKIDKNEENSKITIDFSIPFTEDQPEIAKDINKFITSALIEEIYLTAKTPKNDPLFTYNILLSPELPDWHITFGIRPDILILTVEFDIENIRIL